MVKTKKTVTHSSSSTVWIILWLRNFKLNEKLKVWYKTLDWHFKNLKNEIDPWWVKMIRKIWSVSGSRKRKAEIKRVMLLFFSYLTESSLLNKQVTLIWICQTVSHILIDLHDLFLFLFFFHLFLFVGG